MVNYREVKPEFKAKSFIHSDWLTCDGRDVILLSKQSICPEEVS